MATKIIVWQTEVTKKVSQNEILLRDLITLEVNPKGTSQRKIAGITLVTLNSDINSPGEGGDIGKGPYGSENWLA